MNSRQGVDRCKYGVLNAMNDHRGVVKCEQYGDSYLVLKDVRLRCTFSPEDSANLKADRSSARARGTEVGSGLAVLDFYGHVCLDMPEFIRIQSRDASFRLSEYSDAELKETQGPRAKV